MKKLSIKNINFVKGAKNIKNITAPITLNNMCENATLFAAVDAPIHASIAVIVVPILSPKSTGKVAFKVIQLSAYRFCNIPIVAEDA